MKYLLPILCALALNANAKEVARFVQGDLAVVLHDVQEDCPPGTTLALWHQPNMTIRGCWVEIEGNVYLLWSDGDKHQAPRKMFKVSGA